MRDCRLPWLPLTPPARRSAWWGWAIRSGRPAGAQPVGLGMVVDPAWRGQWVGQALLSALEARAAKLGIDGSGLHQECRRLLPALRLAAHGDGGRHR